MFSYAASFVALALSFCSIADANNVIPNAGFVLRSVPQSQSTKLVAVKARSELQIRDEFFKPNHHCVHEYAENTMGFDGRSRTQFAKTATKYKYPALVLENIEMALSNIQCFRSAIVVEFTDKQTLDDVRVNWDRLDEFLVISSHPGCNIDGERAPYLVNGVRYSEETPKVVFSAKRIRWGEAYNSMTVSFGTTAEQYPISSFRSHDGLRRRAKADASSAVSSSAVATSTANANSSIHSASINFQVPPQQNLLGSGVLKNTVSDVLAIKCKDCTMNGNIDIAEGEFTISNSTTDIGEAVDFINNGYFRVVANNMSARVLLDTSLTLTKPQSWNQTLAQLTLPGFEIPGIAAIGPMFTAVAFGSLQIQGKLDFTYGFDMKVPDNSSITLNVGNITQSSSSGFKDTQFSAIPFTATSPEVSLILGLGLRAQLVLGVNILDGQGSINAGAFFDLPSLKATISGASGVDSKCEPASNLTSVTDIASSIFPNLTHITGTAIIDTGLGVEAALNVPGAVSIASAKSTTLAATTLGLPTACLSFNAAEKTFVSPTPATVAASATSSNSPGATGGVSPAKANKNGGGRMREMPPFTENGRVWWSGAMLLTVFFVALSL